MPDTFTADASAKVNLVLEVLGRRPDGYHEVDTLLQTLALADTVSLQLTGGADRLEVSGPLAEAVPLGPDNLALRAVAELRRMAAIPAAAIHIHKRVPVAAGLGGGASDAATVLRLLQRDLPGLTESDLLAAANATGSDEAFFLRGGTARATGRGECLSRLPPLPPHDVVLLVPPVRLPGKTAHMFQRLDAHPFDTGGRAPALARSLPRTLTSADLYNPFERVAFDAVPGLAALHAQATRKVGGPVRLAGAGPSLFWIGPPGAGADVASRCRGLECHVILTQTTGSQWPL